MGNSRIIIHHLGEKYNSLTILSLSRKVPRNGPAKIRNYKIVCDVRCDCGKTKTLEVQDVVRGKRKTCGCSRVIDYCGKVFGRLTVIGPSYRVEKSRARKVPVKCTCGRFFGVLTNSLVQGNSKSCGCLAVELSKVRLTKHGHTSNRNGRSKEYDAWSAAKSRCYNQNNPRFKYYGANNIGMSNDWKNSFVNFLRDMGLCPQGHTLERKDVSKGYSVENCRWATQEEQCQNTSRTVLNKDLVIKLRQEFDAGTVTITALSRKYKTGWNAVRDAVRRHTWKNVA